MELIGFSAENARSSDSQVKVVMRGSFTSDDPMFPTYSEKLDEIFLHPNGVNADGVFQYLAILHADLTADVYVNNFDVLLEIRAKRPTQAGEMAMLSDIADIQKVKFPSMAIHETDKVVYCFKVGWRSGLYFNLMPREGTNAPVMENLSLDEMEKSIGSLRRILMFYNVYKLLASESDLEMLLDEGWFPFIEIVSGNFKTIGEIYKSGFEVESRLTSLLDTFTADRIKEIASKWWSKPIFNQKKTLLEAGVDAYLLGTESGYIMSIKTLVSELEGILRQIYHVDKGYPKQLKAKDLVGHIIEKGRAKSDSSSSLFLPEYFLRYLGKVFAKFDSISGKVNLSRNSAAHGVANSESYTRSRALQYILALDQIYFYL